MISFFRKIFMVKKDYELLIASLIRNWEKDGRDWTQLNFGEHKKFIDIYSKIFSGKMDVVKFVQLLKVYSLDEINENFLNKKGAKQ